MYDWIIGKEAIAARIKHYRKLASLSQEQLAEQLGERSTFCISGWEQAKSYPPPCMMLKMSELFGVTLQMLYTGTESIPNELSEHEHGLIHAYRIADKQGQLDLDSVALDIMVEAHKKIQNG